MFGFFFLTTQYLQFGRGYSPLLAGVALLPLPIMFVALSPRSATLAARFGAAPVMALGLVIVAGGFGILTVLTPDTPYVVIAAAFAVLGAGRRRGLGPGRDGVHRRLQRREHRLHRDRARGGRDRGLVRPPHASRGGGRGRRLGSGARPGARAGSRRRGRRDRMR